MDLHDRVEQSFSSIEDEYCTLSISFKLRYHHRQIVSCVELSRRTKVVFTSVPFSPISFILYNRETIYLLPDSLSQEECPCLKVITFRVLTVSFRLTSAFTFITYWFSNMTDFKRCNKLCDLKFYIGGWDAFISCIRTCGFTADFPPKPDYTAIFCCIIGHFPLPDDWGFLGFPHNNEIFHSLSSRC